MPKTIQKIESEVFHFPKFEENGLSDFHKPHVSVGHDAGGPSMARQEFKEECDVNEIMARYEATGVLPNVGEPFYFDFTTLPTDMREAMEIMRAGNEAFYTLPAKVRKEFDNDPARFVDFASQPDAIFDGGMTHLDQMRAWGLAPPAPAPAAAPVAAGAPAPAAASPPASAAPAPQAAPAAPTQ